MSAPTCPECGRTFGRPSELGRHRRHAHNVIGQSQASISRRAAAAAENASNDIEGAPVAVPVARRSTRRTAAPPSTLEVTMATLRQASPSGMVRIDDLPEIVDWMRMTNEIIQRVSSPPR